MYIKPPSTAPYSTRQLRLDNPNTSFPANPSDALLAQWGVYPVEVEPVPDHDPMTHQVVQLEPVKIGDKWVQGWQVDNLSSADIHTMYVLALESHYDSVAQSKRYDNRLTFALRAGYPGPYQAEGLVFAQWMDNCNAMAYQYMLDVEAGKLERPTIEAMIEMLPNIDFSDGLAALEAEADNGEG